MIRRTLLASSAALGLALLFAVNLIFGSSFILPLNTLTLAVAGVLGLPGVATLAVMAAL